MLPSRYRACTPTTSSSSSHRSRTARLRRSPEGRIQAQAGQICHRRAGFGRLAGYCDMQQPPVLWGPVCSVSAPPPLERCGHAHGSWDWSSPAPRLQRPPHMNQPSDLVDAAIFFHRGHHAWLRVSPPPQPAATFPTVVPPSVPICLHHASRPLCRRRRRPQTSRGARAVGADGRVRQRKWGNLATAMALAWMCIWIPFCYCVRGREG